MVETFIRGNSLRSFHKQRKKSFSINEMNYLKKITCTSK